MVLSSTGRSDGPNVTNPWIEKYIFPGGYIPALSEVLCAVERAGLLITDIEILRLHYAQTLEAGASVSSLTAIRSNIFTTGVLCACGNSILPLPKWHFVNKQ